MTWFYVCIGGLLLFALFIDWRRKRNNNNSQHPTHADAKPGESQNYQMGDNRYSGPGE
ncbi:hypothetical protein [Fictibacillus barbaricus]|uniref:Uncharacterized protein n=1 Tax=Fictibacillus barbaricus TaxID=182136 RepID=A0ABS2Z9F8_9BACL|nr:hypothetical protein [Fictibacillus barbaricus]MBN3544810.1 hypothetical protein [Fictibacillus barbaricus]GGB63884.1 hypothetical protein GCM10007199_32430 [Fictibacillus barbaricus]